MNRQLFKKYMTLNLLCLIIFIITKNLYLTDIKISNWLYNVPSLLGTIIITNLLLPLIVDLKKHKNIAFKIIVLIGTILMFYDEFSPFISKNKIFDILDLIAIVIGAIITYTIFYKYFKPLKSHG